MYGGSYALYGQAVQDVPKGGRGSDHATAVLAALQEGARQVQIARRAALSLSEGGAVQGKGNTATDGRRGKANRRTAGGLYPTRAHPRPFQVLPGRPLKYGSANPGACLRKR